MNLVTVVLAVLVALTLYFAVLFFKDYAKTQKEGKLESGNFLTLGLVGFATNFFDTLGIGSFAPTTALLKNFKLSADRTIPGTLNVSMTIPVVIEALIFITVIEVEPITLVAMLASATLGAFLGAGIVAKLPERKIQLGMGVALLAVVVMMLAGQLGIMPSGGEAIGLTGIKLVVAVVGNFVLGALMTLGIGLYAPCMALVFALGLSPKVAFPIMMGSCAFLMPVASAKFVKEGAYDRKASMAITLFGAVGVLIAAYIVKSLPLDVLRWLVDAVIIYTAMMMFKSAADNKKKEEQTQAQ
jgi:uncharacterized membrane protein YfcA